MTGSKREAARRARHETLLRYERALWASHVHVAGLDEAGAGPLAGPVVAGCVVLDPARVDALLGVDDSKRLSEARREQLAAAIRENVLAYAVAEASVAEIERINIREAGLLAMRRALAAVEAKLNDVGHLLVDARDVPDTEVPQTALIKGDATSLSIAAASILAKVTRDALMIRAAEQYPAYGFERHKGYGTREHVEAIHAHGVTPLHRKTFEPIATLLRQPALFGDQSP